MLFLLLLIFKLLIFHTFINKLMWHGHVNKIQCFFGNVAPCLSGYKTALTLIISYFLLNTGLGVVGETAQERPCSQHIKISMEPKSTCALPAPLQANIQIKHNKHNIGTTLGSKAKAFQINWFNFILTVHSHLTYRTAIKLIFRNSWISSQIGRSDGPVA